MPNQYVTSSAIAVLDAFAGTGATAFDVTWLDIDGITSRGFESGRSANELRRGAEWRLAKATAAQQSLIIRPRSTTVLFVQLDDLTPEKAAELERYAFLTLRTSPGSCQAWLAISDGPKENDKEAAKRFRARVRRGVGVADANASGATRIAGSFNFKKKYCPNFPRVEIVSQADGRLLTVVVMSEAGLIAPEPTEGPPAPVASIAATLNRRRGLPDYQLVLSGAPPKLDGKPDRSKADYWWCRWAIDRGYGVNEVAERLLDVSEKAKERVRKGDSQYALLTAQSAARAEQARRKS
jgi:hypothetical protein